MATVTLGVLSCVLGWLVLKTGHSVAATVSDPRPSVTMDTAQTVWPPGQQYNTSLTDHHTTTVISFGPDSTNTSRASTSNRSDTSTMDDHEAKQQARSSDVKTIRFWLRDVTVVILASLGLVCNLVTILVWRRETSFKVTVFLFQYLAGWDSIYLLSTGTLMVVYYHPSDLKYYVYHLANLAQLISVHVTLVITVTRWIAVTSPLHASRLLTSKRIYLSCVIVFIYCVILETLNILVFTSFTSATFVTKRIIGLAIPLLLLLIFNLSLLWNATRRSPALEEAQLCEKRPLRQGTSEEQCPPPSHDTVKGSAAPESPACEGTTQEPCSVEEMRDRHQNQPQEQKEQPRQQQQNPPRPPSSRQLQGQEYEQQQQNQQGQQTQTHTNSKKQRSNGGNDVTLHRPSQQQVRRQQMVRAVLLISLCSFIAYPVGVSMQAYAFTQREVLAGSVSLILGVVPLLLHIINSSINMVIYSLFVTRFKQLARPLCQRLSVCLCCGHTTCARTGTSLSHRRSIPESVSSQVSAVPTWTNLSTAGETA